MMQHHMIKGHGFTLIELLIALSIFSLMSVMAYGGLSAVIQTRETVTASMQRLGEIQKTIHRLQTDMESAQARPIRDEYGDLRPAMMRELDGLGLVFTRGGWRNPLSVTRSAMQRVHYRLEDKKLLRRSWPMLDGSRQDQYTETTLLENVEEVRWRFLDDVGTQGQDFEDLEWQEQWPPDAQDVEPNRLPRAVELVLVTEDWGDIRYLYRINPGMPLISDYQPSGGGSEDDDDSGKGESDEDEDIDEDEDFFEDDDLDEDEDDF